MNTPPRLIIPHDHKTGAPSQLPTSDQETTDFIRLVAKITGTAVLTNTAPSPEQTSMLYNRAHAISANHDAMLIMFSDLVRQIFRPSGTKDLTLRRAATGAAQSMAGIGHITVLDGEALDPEHVMAHLAQAFIGIQQIMNMFGWTRSDVELYARGIITAQQEKEEKK